MKKPMSCMMYAVIVALAGCIGVVSILVFRGCTIKRIDKGYIVTPPPGWRPYGETTAGPELIEAPSTEYTAGDTTTPVEPKKKPRHPFIAPPGTLGEGGDVRDLIPWIESTGPEPGSAASEACEE